MVMSHSSSCCHQSKDLICAKSSLGTEISGRQWRPKPRAVPPLLFALQPGTVEKGAGRSGDLLNVPNARCVALQCADGFLALNFSYPGSPFRLIAPPLLHALLYHPLTFTFHFSPFPSDDTLYHSIYLLGSYTCSPHPAFLGQGTILCSPGQGTPSGTAPTASSSCSELNL